MKCKYTKKQLEEIYNCKISKTDEGLYVADGLPDNTGNKIFGYADGWNLDELHESIREDLYTYPNETDCYEFEGEKMCAEDVISALADTGRIFIEWENNVGKITC